MTEWGSVYDILGEQQQDGSGLDFPPLNFLIDAKRFGNVSCFIKHSFCPNVLMQFVLHDHLDIRFPHVMLFAMENIPPLTELTFDYGFC
jgi:euchromatic histone-lysine N-methyltransferase